MPVRSCELCKGGTLRFTLNHSKIKTQLWYLKTNMFSKEGTKIIRQLSRGNENVRSPSVNYLRFQHGPQGTFTEDLARNI